MLPSFILCLFPSLLNSFSRISARRKGAMGGLRCCGKRFANGCHEADRGEGRTPAAHAPSHPRSRPGATIRSCWAQSLLGRALAPRTFASQPDQPYPLGSDASTHRPLAASCSHLSSLSSPPHERCHPSEEPDAGKPLSRSCWLALAPPTLLGRRSRPCRGINYTHWPPCPMIHVRPRTRRHLAPLGSSGSHISTRPRPVTESKSSPYNSKFGASAPCLPDSGSHLFQIVAQVFRIVEI